MLASGGADSVRGTANDAVFFGLWLERGGAADLARGGFDGAYSYFSSPIASWAADPAHWPDMAREAASLGLLFSPSVSPGYDDSKIRPWNAATRVDRLAGATYRAAWAAARATRPDVVSITSWNEWGEGSQIEPAVPRAIDVDKLAPLGAALPRETRDALRLRVPDGYDDYGAGGPNLYLDITRDEAAAFTAAPHERAPPPRYEAEL